MNTERSVPSSLFRAASASGLASRPRTRRATSPGRTCAPRKTMTLRIQSVTTARPRRLRRNLAVSLASCPLPPAARRRGSRPRSGLSQVDVAHRRLAHADEVRLDGEEVRVEVGEDDRRLLEEELLDLPGHVPLRVEVERRDVLLDEPVVLLVPEVGRVPRALARQGSDEEDVRNATVAVVRDPHHRVE